MNILIIEDDRVLGKRIRDVFYEQVITNIITLIHSFDDFLTEYPSLWLYDIVLTDLNLWNYSEPEGFKIIQKIRELDKSIPIVVISWYDDIEKLRYAFSLGISDYIVKPVRLKELEVRVMNWLHTYYSTKLIHTGQVFSYQGMKYNIDQNIFYYQEQCLPLSKNDKYILSLFFQIQKKFFQRVFFVKRYGAIFIFQKREISESQ